jgi:tRNA dimethylallyltransferase
VSGERAAPPLVCVLGPTGTGKTEAAILIAEAVGGEVVNFDSRQIYRDLPIVTAQPSPDERARCPHRLYGFAPLERKIDAGQYARLLDREAGEIRGRGRVPILAGGTGLYLRAYLEGLADIPAVPASVREAVAARCRELGPAALHEELAKADPAYAARVSPADRQRVTRALEVYQATGKPLSAWHAAQAAETAGLARPAVKVGLAASPEALAERLAARIRAMLGAGALDELRRALALCPDPTAPGFSGIGCREIADHLQGRTNLEECAAIWLKNTRAYAKRQMTWFKKDGAVAWFGPGEAASLVRHVCAVLDQQRTTHGKTP